jgi:hypothetical protein
MTMSTTSSSVLPLNGRAPASIVYTDTPIDHMSHWPENTARCETVYRAATQHVAARCNTVRHVATCRLHRPSDRAYAPLLRAHAADFSLTQSGKLPHSIPRRARLIRILRSGAGHKEEGKVRNARRTALEYEPLRTSGAT